MSLCSFHTRSQEELLKYVHSSDFPKLVTDTTTVTWFIFLILLNKPGFLTQHTLSLLCWVWLVNAVLAPANTSHIVINLCTLQINLLCVVHAIVIVLVHKNKRLSPIRQTKSTIPHRRLLLLLKYGLETSSFKSWSSCSIMLLDQIL